jgi:hypothetical protein
MGEAAWKVTQRRITRLWGAESAWLGEKGSDARGACPVSLEVKRSKRRVPEGRWIDQAVAQGKAEGRPWVLVVAGHGDRHPIAVVDHDWLHYLAGEAGLL